MWHILFLFRGFDVRKLFLRSALHRHWIFDQDILNRHGLDLSASLDRLRLGSHGRDNGSSLGRWLDQLAETRQWLGLMGLGVPRAIDDEVETLADDAGSAHADDTGASPLIDLRVHMVARVSGPSAPLWGLRLLLRFGSVAGCVGDNVQILHVKHSWQEEQALHKFLVLSELLRVLANGLGSLHF